MALSRPTLYRANGITYYRPWVFLITDGAPQGEGDGVVDRATQRIKDDEGNKRVAFFAVGVEGADMARLGQMVVRTPILLKGLDFREMFVWLSTSMHKVSQSKLDEDVALPPLGWGKI